MKQHKHAALIKAWADGAKIEFQLADGTWFNATPDWSEFITYRIKPKPDVVQEFHLSFFKGHVDMIALAPPNIRLIFEGDTGKLKAAEVLK